MSPSTFFDVHISDIIFNNALEGVHAKMQFLEKSFNRLDEHGVCEMWITGISVICLLFFMLALRKANCNSFLCANPNQRTI